MEPVNYSGVLHTHADKHRCFSTSTPFLDNSTKNNGRTLSGMLFDSGLGSSMSDSIAAEKPSFEHIPVCASSVVSQNSPVKYAGATADVTITHSPIFHKNSSFDTDRQNESLEISNISFSRSRNLFRRKLNLDLDIFEDDESTDETHEKLKSNNQHHLINLTLADDVHSLSVVQTTPLSAASIIEQRTIDLDKVLEACSPAVVDRLIGRKMGKSHVDILTELQDRNISSTSTILSYLDPEDLCSVCMVSTAWQSVCINDRRANQRRQRYIKQCKRNRRETRKENACYKQPRLPNRSLTTVLQTLATVQPTGEELPNLQPDRGRTSSQHFIEAAKTLKNDEKLHKCPRCRKPAKVPPVQERGKCQNSDCGFDYCIKCLGEFHGSKPCAPIASKRTKTDSIGTKKSKKNLKRL